MKHYEFRFAGSTERFTEADLDSMPFIVARLDKMKVGDFQRFPSFTATRIPDVCSALYPIGAHKYETVAVPGVVRTLPCGDECDQRETAPERLARARAENGTRTLALVPPKGKCCAMCDYGPGCENAACVCHVPHWF